MSRNRNFDSTQWSLVLAAGRAPTAASRDALDSLCQRYWFPVYAYVRRHGYGAADAEDLTQSFFARMIEKRVVGDADPERGRFRAFLLTAVKHFLANEYDRATALKRGGRTTIVSLDVGVAERRYRAEPADNLTPERVFGRRWALTVLESVIVRLRSEQEQADQGDRFDLLKDSLIGDGGSYAELARSLGMTEGAVKIAVHRLRKRYRALLREEIAATLDDPARVDDELRELGAALM